MDPHIGSWVRQSFNEEVHEPFTSNTLCLQELMRRLLLDRSDLLAKQHTAGADASMVLQVVFALHELASI